MNSMLKAMRMQKNKIPAEVIPVFEEIVQMLHGEEREAKFYQAMEKHLTREQRFRIFEQCGSCKGTGQDQERKAFAKAHADEPLSQRLEQFKSTFGRPGVLNADGTITVRFACRHGYYKHAPQGKFQFPESVETYFERCAGGRLYEYQKALGVPLKIKSVDISPLQEHVTNPVVFTFEVVE